MSTVFLKILNMSISASFLIAAVVLVRFALKKAPRWVACLLWALVAVRLVCPFSIQSALSLIPSAQTVPDDIMLSSTPQVQTGLSFVNEAVNPVIAERFTPEAAASANPLQILIPLLAVTWLFGVFTMFVYALISFLGLKKRVSASLEAHSGVYVCDEIASPFILGVFRPRIYVPSALSGEALESVLAHERAHLARRDHIWKPLGFSLLALHWFNPLCWLAYVLLCRDIEAACDEKVVRDYDRDRIAAYSQTLLDCALPRHSITACPLAFGEVGVKQRVRSVLHYKKPAFWIILAALAVCAVVAVCFLTSPKADDGAPFAKEYWVTDILYEAGAHVGGLRAQEAPIYRVMGKGELYILEDKQSDNWLCAGTLTEIELTKNNFDAYFHGAYSSAAPIRRNTMHAWTLRVSELPNSTFYYLLKLKTGDVLLACGYYDPEGETDPESDDTYIRWLFALQTPKPVQVDGEPDLSLLNYKNAVSTAADMSEVQTIYCTPYSDDTDSAIVVGYVDGTALARYLSAAEWTPCTIPEAPASPGSVEFILHDEHRITVYLMHRLAKVVSAGETRWYMTKDDDYEEAVEMFHSETADGYARPSLRIDGWSYYDPFRALQKLPDGFTLVGTLTQEQAHDTGLAGMEYYADPDRPYEYIVYQLCPKEIDYAVEPEYTMQYMRWVREDKMPTYASSVLDLSDLRSLVPEYFELDASNGLTVCVWQMAAGSYSCGLVEGIHAKIEDADLLPKIGDRELLHMKGVSVDKMKAILASYGEDVKIAVLPIRMPYSSYAYVIDDAYAAQVRRLFFPEE